MRAVLVFLSSMVVVVFTIVLLLTFFGRDLIANRAGAMIDQRLESGSETAVAKMESVLEAKPMQMLLGEEQVGAALEEVGAYKNDPSGYARALVRREKSEAELVDTEDKSRIGKLVSNWKADLSGRYESIVDKVLTDVRMVAGSNVVAGLLGFVLAYWSRGSRSYAPLAYSALLVLAIGIATYSFLDGLTLIGLLFGSSLGWFYPVSILLVYVGLCVHVRMHGTALD